jgi:hypothetical protein
LKVMCHAGVGAGRAYGVNKKWTMLIRRKT